MVLTGVTAPKELPSTAAASCLRANQVPFTYLCLLILTEHLLCPRELALKELEFNESNKHHPEFHYKGQQDGADKGTCYQAWWPELDP